MEYFVYILECRDKTLYCGFTNNMEKRLIDHNTTEKGAKYTRVRRPVKLRYFEKFNNRSDAQKREFQIKKLTRSQKLELIFPAS